MTQLEPLERRSTIAWNRGQSPHLPFGILIDRRHPEIVDWPPRPAFQLWAAYGLAILAGALAGVVTLWLVRHAQWHAPSAMQGSPARAPYIWERFYRQSPDKVLYELGHSADGANTQ